MKLGHRRVRNVGAALGDSSGRYLIAAAVGRVPYIVARARAEGCLTRKGLVSFAVARLVMAPDTGVLLELVAEQP